MTVKGGVGKIVEYAGEGVKTLSVPERATITNMGAELGATTSIFPSDEATKKFLEAQGRGDVWVPLASDPTQSTTRSTPSICPHSSRSQRCRICRTT